MTFQRNLRICCEGIIYLNYLGTHRNEMETYNIEGKKNTHTHFMNNEKKWFF
jgi:hypothetical protein